MLNLFLQQLVCDTVFTWKTSVLRKGCKVNTCGACTYSGKRDKNRDLSFYSFKVKQINAETGYKLTDNIFALVTSGLGPDVARVPPISSPWSTQLLWEE
jgi:hypothetical protein